MRGALRKKVALERIQARERADPWTAACEETREEVKGLDSILASLGFSNYNFRKDKDFEIVDYESAPSIEKSKAKDYLDFYVFPYLLPAIEALIFFAIDKRIMQCRWTTFSPLDYLAEYLFNANPRHPGRQEASSSIFEAPFAKDWLRRYPRIPYPSWLYMSKEDGARRIQRYFRGYLARKREDVQELRQFWRDLKKDEEEKSKKIDASAMDLDREDDEVYDDQEPVLPPFRTHSEECELCAHFRQLVGALAGESNSGSREARKNPVMVPCNSPEEMEEMDESERKHLYDKCCFNTGLLEKTFKKEEKKCESCGKFSGNFKNPRLLAAEKYCHSKTIAATAKAKRSDGEAVEITAKRQEEAK